MIWWLTWGDVSNPRGFPPGRIAEYTREEQRAPWTSGTTAQFKAVQAAGEAAYQTWRAANPLDTRKATARITASDGSQWSIDPSGKLVPA